MTRRPTRWAIAALCLLIAGAGPTACGGGSGDGPGGGGGAIGTATADAGGDGDRSGDGVGTSDGGSRGAGGCTYRLDSVRYPTRLSNTGAACDYLLTGYTEVNALLEIEPGVVLQAGDGASLVVDGGEIRAIGRADARIVFEGAERAAGYWQGIRVVRASGLVLDHVDVRDAGRICARLWCPDTGLLVENTAFSFTDSTVSNSYVHALQLGENVRVDAFARNRFHGNRWSPVVLGNYNVRDLDVASDYAGGNEPNGAPWILVANGSQEAGERFVWKALNQPYLIAGYLDVHGGTLVLEPGVEILFDEQGWLDIEGNGTVEAIGSAARPIVLRGRIERPGYWDGITFTNSPWTSNRLAHVNVHHSGNMENLVSAGAAIHMESSRIALEHVTMSANARGIITCEEPYFFADLPSTEVKASIVELGTGNRSFDNGEDRIDAECEVIGN